MANATFYLLNESDNNEQETIFNTACALTCHYFQQGQRIYVAARDKAQAEQIDEWLWQRDPTDFVPHNLVGEGPSGASPVEIGWSGVRHSGHRSVLINLAPEPSNFAPSFAQVIDFVPCDETLKQQARNRYKAYRMAGIQLHTLAIDDTP